jgi:CBS domain-containing protein
MALFFGFAGLFGNPILVFIALFVWLGADQEASMVRMKSSLSGIPLSRAMITRFQTLAPDEPISVAVSHLLAGFQQDFPVVESSRVVGLLSRGDVVTALSEGRVNDPVSSVMTREFATAHPNEMLDSISNRMHGAPALSVPVIRNGQLVGILTTENLGEFLMIQDALRASSSRPA